MFCAGRRQTLVTRPSPDGVCMASRIPTSNRSSAADRRQRYTADPGVDRFRGNLWRRGESIHARRPECPRGTAVRHSAFRRRARCTGGALIRLDREVYGSCQWQVRVAITNRLSVERGRLRDDFFMNPVSSASMQSTRNWRLTEAQSHLESLLVVWCSRWTTI